LIEPPLVLDCDVLSSFAWVNRLDILEKLYAKNMIVLEEVINELSKIKHIAQRVESCITGGSIRLVSIPANAPEALELARLLESGRYGRGEAACLAYLKYNFGSLGSNNISDVRAVCSEKNIYLLTVPDIINAACQANIITLEEANTVWINMIKKKRKLPTNSFYDFLATSLSK
jgi:predicted nucleic acid-binding protein